MSISRGVKEGEGRREVASDLSCLPYLQKRAVKWNIYPIMAELSWQFMARINNTWLGHSLPFMTLTRQPEPGANMIYTGPTLSSGSVIGCSLRLQCLLKCVVNRTLAVKRTRRGLRTKIQLGGVQNLNQNRNKKWGYSQRHPKEIHMCVQEQIQWFSGSHCIRLVMFRVLSG